jgi:hypothetical protein
MRMIPAMVMALSALLAPMTTRAEPSTSTLLDPPRIPLPPPPPQSARASTEATPVVVVVIARPTDQPAGPFVPPPPRSMKRGAFRSLIALLESTSFSSDKLDVVKTAASRNRFTVAQVGEILGTLDFSSDRLAAVKALRDRIVDPDNAFLLGQHFDFSSDKKKVAALFAR